MVQFAAGLILLGTLVAAYLIARGLRRPWYPRFLPEITAVIICCTLGAVAYGGVAYQQAHINVGEPE